MKRVWFISIAAFALLLGWLLFSHDEPKEPYYRGKSLTRWSGELFIGLPMSRSLDNTDLYANPAAVAIRQIGTNAFPFLRHELLAKDSALKSNVLYRVNGLKWKHVHINTAAERRNMAMLTYFTMGGLAELDTPELAKLADDPDVEVRATALRVLSVIHPKKEIYLPILLRHLSDPNPTIRDEVALELYRYFPKEAERVRGY